MSQTRVYRGAARTAQAAAPEAEAPPPRRQRAEECCAPSMEPPPHSGGTIIPVQDAGEHIAATERLIVIRVSERVHIA